MGPTDKFREFCVLGEQKNMTLSINIYKLTNNNNKPPQNTMNSEDICERKMLRATELKGRREEGKSDWWRFRGVGL